MNTNMVLNEGFFDLDMFDQIQLLSATKVIRLPPEFGGEIVKILNLESGVVGFNDELQHKLYIDNESPNVVILKNRQFLWGNTNCNEGGNRA